ncbi:UDP-N-acetylglucosamine--N-acetylmuramyl-(pentapeptide) pyrophosphoryl-undecaprenol N-acetylglucosamine transferase [Candidatus Roizmanbacteria bacterium]|nr:UDP-N-acetylglucosamine--N-acetylmuramyl-(pentapeptide) pyrophosphoryl-undecaprenol N-acetylglucosamine transferase [Candidatus Roizmanbacteria bacterium]
MSTKKTMIITGGHLSPAIAVIEELLKDQAWDIHFVGRKFTFSEKKESLSYEYETITHRGIAFHPISAARFPHRFSFSALWFCVYFLYSLFRSLLLLYRLNPCLILSFGGYVGAPVVAAGIFARTRVLLHDQAVIPGRANRILGFGAAAIAVSWDESVVHFSPRLRKRIVVTGNPIRKALYLQSRPHDQTVKGILETNQEKGLLFVTGGSTGAHAVNKLIEQSLPQLLSHYRIIHQCGDSQFHDYERLSALRESLSPKQKQDYLPIKFVTQDDSAVLLQQAAIIISRAGANTVCELAVLGKRAVLIPLPYAPFDEQKKNAEKLARWGAGVILNQQTATPALLINTIVELSKHQQSYEHRAKAYSISPEITRHRHAASTLVGLIRSYTAYCKGERYHY